MEALCKETEKLFSPVPLSSDDRLSIRKSQKHMDAWVIQAFRQRPDGTRGPASFYAMNSWLHRIPERKELGSGLWSVKATDITAMIIFHLWSSERLVFDDESRIEYTYLVQRFLSQSINAQMKAEFKVNGTVPVMPPEFHEHPDLPLSDYQRVALLSSLNQESSALFMEQGTGKTPIVVRRLSIESQLLSRDEGRPYRAIIVCPRNVRSNWAREIKRFSSVPGRIAVLRGGQLNRAKLLTSLMELSDDAKFQVVICSYETVQRTWSLLRMIEWDLAVADESHLIKSPKAKRTESMIKLSRRASQRMILTGTPVANSVTDLWSQLEFLGEGQSGFIKHEAFRRYYCSFKREAGSQHEVLIGFKNLPVLQERIARIAITFTKEEVLPDLPEKSFDVCEISMTSTQAKYYKQLSEQLAAEIEQDLIEAEESGSRSITANNALTKLLRLSQITSGYIVADREFDDDGAEVLTGDDRITWFKASPKVDQLIEDLKSKGPKSKTIVWACWVPLIKQIEKRLTEEGIKFVSYYGGTKDKDREEAEVLFNGDPETKVFVGNPAAGGTGMNLPGYIPDHIDTDLDHGCNADHSIFMACTWSIIQVKQAQGRNHGKSRCRVPVRVTYYIVPGTIDEEIYNRLNQKSETILQIQDVRDIMSRILSAGVTIGD